MQLICTAALLHPGCRSFPATKFHHSAAIGWHAEMPLATKSAADFAFLLRGFQFLKDEGVIIILLYGVLFRGGAEERIRKKLLDDGHIDMAIGLPPCRRMKSSKRSKSPLGETTSFLQS